jgi:uncharacterized protein (DUF924 family)
MKAYSKVSQLLGVCLLQFVPLFLQAQVHSNASMAVPYLQAPNASMEENRIEDILNFWFGFLPGPDFFPGYKLQVWFASTPEIDRQIRNNFSQDMMNAARGEYNSWRDTPEGLLALILLLDQFPRHIYRNQPRAFALDRMARALVLEGLQKGYDKQLFPLERAFFYLPLEHSEDLAMQNLSVASYRQLVAQSPAAIRPQMQDFLQAAISHQQQIMRFGRFPYRNAILGRESTPEEIIFLAQWGRLTF